MEHLFKFSIDVDKDLILTEIIKSDQESFVTHLSDGIVAANTLRMPYPYGVLDAENWIKLNEDEIDREGRPGCYAIRERATLRLIGCIGYDGGIDFNHNELKLVIG